MLVLDSVLDSDTAVRRPHLKLMVMPGELPTELFRGHIFTDFQSLLARKLDQKTFKHTNVQVIIHRLQFSEQFIHGWPTSNMNTTEMTCKIPFSVDQNCRKRRKVISSQKHFKVGNHYSCLRQSCRKLLQNSNDGKIFRFFHLETPFFDV